MIYSLFSVGEDDGSLGLNVADTGAIAAHCKSGEAGITPGLAPRVLDEPIVLIQVVIVAKANNGHGCVHRGLNSGAFFASDNSTLVELELLGTSRDACSDRSQFNSNFELVDIVRQDVDEVSNLHSALLLIILAALRLSNIRVVLLSHQFVVNGVLEAIGVEATMATPRGVVAI